MLIQSQTFCFINPITYAVFLFIHTVKDYKLFKMLSIQPQRSIKYKTHLIEIHNFFFNLKGKYLHFSKALGKYSPVAYKFIIMLAHHIETWGFCSSICSCKHHNENCTATLGRSLSFPLYHLISNVCGGIWFSQLLCSFMHFRIWQTMN